MTDTAVSHSRAAAEAASRSVHLASTRGTGPAVLAVPVEALVVEETGGRFLEAQGTDLVAVDSPEAFLSDTPTAF